METPVLVLPDFYQGGATAATRDSLNMRQNTHQNSRPTGEMRGRSVRTPARYATFESQIGGDCGGLIRTDFDAQNEETDPLDNPPFSYVVPP
jgi:hypothetical protein